MIKSIKVLNFLTFLSFIITLPVAAQLKSSNNQADYLAITPSQFENTLQPFIEWRQQKGLNIKVADLQQIYTEFPDSSAQYSIKDFISYALTFWQNPKPNLDKPEPKR
ncbi:MAG: C25 family cysteine peptidase [Bacteroidetes bacterium]|nr:C25 family cysteine peptidase [Bacteroidota bacterium]